MGVFVFPDRDREGNAGTFLVRKQILLSAPKVTQSLTFTNDGSSAVDSLSSTLLDECGFIMRRRVLSTPAALHKMSRGGATADQCAKWQIHTAADNVQPAKRSIQRNI